MVLGAPGILLAVKEFVVCSRARVCHVAGCPSGHRSLLLLFWRLFCSFLALLKRLTPSVVNL